MKIEYEAKILDVDVDEIVKKLSQLGAKKISDRLMRRFTYDFTPIKPNSWIRLRDEGDRTTLCIKEIQTNQVDGTKELEIEVSDFEDCSKMLAKLGYTFKSYQENRRISYSLEKVHIDIDYWPLIPPYVEVEGMSKKAVEAALKQLGFRLSQTTSVNTIEIYKRYGLDLEQIKELTFSSK